MAAACKQRAAKPNLILAFFYSFTLLLSFICSRAQDNLFQAKRYLEKGRKGEGEKSNIAIMSFLKESCCSDAIFKKGSFFLFYKQGKKAIPKEGGNGKKLV